MDLGIAGKQALLIGASGGLGAACADRLAEAGCRLHLVARRPDRLSAFAAELAQRHGTTVGTSAGNLTDPEARSRIVRDCPDPDILIISGAWPERAVNPTAWTMADWQVAVDAMMLPAIDFVARIYPGMVTRKFGRIVVITSRMIKDPELDLAMPAAARLGLTGYLKALSREIAASGVTVNTLLPGAFGTDTQNQHIAEMAGASGRSEAAVIADRTRQIPAGRLGKPHEFSSLCAYLCSAEAGFMTGQALVMDGGTHTGIW